MFKKLIIPCFLTDMKPLLSAVQAELLTDATAIESFCKVFTRLIDQISGAPWGRADEMSERFGVKNLLLLGTGKISK